MAANDLLIAGEARVKVIPTPGPWLGITHPEDREHVRRGIRELIAVGHYTDDLSAVDYRRFRLKHPLVP